MGREGVGRFEVGAAGVGAVVEAPGAVCIQGKDGRGGWKENVGRGELGVFSLPIGA